MMPIEFFAFALLFSGVLLILAYMSGLMLLKQLDPADLELPSRTADSAASPKDFPPSTLRT